jgi:hypothetical protein
MSEAIISAGLHALALIALAFLLGGIGHAAEMED